MDWLSRRNLLPWWQPAVDGKGSWPQRRFSSGPPLMDQSPDWHHPEYTAANKREEWLTDWKMKTGQATGGQWMVYRRSPHSKANCRYIQNIQKQNRDDLFSFRILELHTHMHAHAHAEHTQSTHQLFRLDAEELDGLGSILCHSHREVWIYRRYIQLTANKQTNILIEQISNPTLLMQPG